ncbi:MAG: hypothetical protein AAF611_02390 [Bacteroidota bacterium]
MKTINCKSILLVVFVVGICTSCSQKSDLAIFGMKGNVKSCNETHFIAVKKSGEWQAGNPSELGGNNEVLFAENGKYQQITFFDSSNQLIEKMIPQRKDGEIVKENRYDRNGKLVGTITLTYVSSSKMEFENVTEKGVKLAKGVSALEKGRIASQEIEIFDLDGSLRDTILVEFTYDANGNLIKQKQTNKEGQIIFDHRFEYSAFDEQGNWTKRLDYYEETGDKEAPVKVVQRTFTYFE